MCGSRLVNSIHESLLGLSFPLFLSLVRGSGNCTPSYPSQTREVERDVPIGRTHTATWYVSLPGIGREMCRQDVRTYYG